MKLKILTAENKEKGNIELPNQFYEDIRPDIIKRAVLSIQSHKRQRYGSDPEAGMKVSAKLSRRRHKYKGAYGHGIGRVPRKSLTHRGTQFYWVGAEAPGTVGGRRAHAPKAEKKWEQKVNKKENRKAIRSAISATVDKELVLKRGHNVPDNYPFVIDEKFESLERTKDLKKALLSLGLEQELSRSSIKKIRAGIGKMRGRKYKKRKGPLLVVDDNTKIAKAGNNIPGLDVVKVNELNTEVLAPGAVPGRLTLFTESALKKLSEKNYFN